MPKRINEKDVRTRKRMGGREKKKKKRGGRKGGKWEEISRINGSFTCLRGRNDLKKYCSKKTNQEKN